MQVIIQSNVARLDVFNVHNHALSKVQVSIITGALMEAKRLAAQNPTAHFVVINGDFNFSSEEAVVLNLPQAAVKRAARQHHARAEQWRRALSAVWRWSAMFLRTSSETRTRKRP